MLVHSDVYAGQDGGVNGAIVRFNEAGLCIGIVAYADGRVCNPPDPLRPEDFAVFAQIPGYTLTDEEPPPETAPEEPVVEAAAEWDIPAVPAAPTWAAGEAAPTVPPLLDEGTLGDMTRSELVAYAATHGEKISTRIKRRALELLREAGLVAH